MIKNLKLYVFDMGRVITKPAKLDIIHKESMMKCKLNDFKENFYHSKEASAVYKGIISDNEFFKFIKEVCKTNLSVEKLKSLYTKSKGGIYLDTIKTIQDLKDSGNMVFLLSNLKEIDYDYLNNNMDLGLFDKLFLSYNLGMCKPNEDIFKYVINNLGTNEFHFFDDSIENIEAANKLGISGHLTTGEEITKYKSLIRN